MSIYGVTSIPDESFDAEYTKLLREASAAAASSTI
jgi:hypothetical protein